MYAVGLEGNGIAVDQCKPSTADIITMTKRTVPNVTVSSGKGNIHILDVYSICVYCNVRVCIQ